MGSHIADALSQQGYQVIILDLEPSRYLRDDQTFVQGDVRDLNRLVKLLENVDYVYHMAALADLNAAKTRPVDTVAINIVGTVNILEAARQNNVKRFVFGSTVYVYSREGGFYRCSKQASESYVEEYERRFGLKYTILRFGSLYGTRTDETNGVYKLLKRFIEKDEMSYDGTSNDKREYIHVLDAAKLSTQVLGQDYENKNLIITGNERMNVADLFTMFGEILGKETQIHFKGDENPGQHGHYSQTPYAFTPKLGKKLVTHEYVDMGQGLIQLIEYFYKKEGRSFEKD